MKRLLFSLFSLVILSVFAFGLSALSEKWGGDEFAAVADTTTPVTTLVIQCRADGKQATISWPALPVGTIYFPRVTTSNGTCPAGWKFYADGSLCYKNNFMGTTTRFTTRDWPGAHTVYIYAGTSPDPLVSSPYLQGTFNCDYPSMPSGKPTPQVSFGDSEGNPANWPEPVFTDGATPWRTIAKNYDKLVFTTNKNYAGDVSFNWFSSKYNLLKGEAAFGLEPYLGNSKGTGPSYDGITTFGALVGGSIGGIDYSAKILPPSTTPTNLVRLIKKYYQTDTGANVFIGSVHGSGGNSFWYDLMPNIFACQLADMYGAKADGSETQTLASLCNASINQWYKAVDYFRDGKSTPEFAYRSVTLAPRTVNGVDVVPFQPLQTCGNLTWDPHIPRDPSSKAVCSNLPTWDGQAYESDSSAGVAYLGAYQYLKTGNANGLKLANWGLNFLDQVTYNPYYEMLLPFGAAASARLNAEKGTNHNTVKILNYVFAESPIRSYWGMIGESWGGAPVYGTMGERKSSYYQNPSVHGPGYAFAMNTMGIATTLAPIPRYDESTAATIGKYLAHVAHNARYFFPQYEPASDPTTGAYIVAAADGIYASSLPFEGIKSSWPGLTSYEPYGTGDPVVNNWGYKTDLGIYSGIYVGAMAKLFQPTNVANIYQIDLIAVDFPKPKAYPTYLFYNPYSTAQSIDVNLTLARKADSRVATDVVLYDLVSNAVIGSGKATDASASINIPATTAVVVAVVPTDQGLEVVDGKVQTKKDGTVIDYHFLTQ